MQLFEFINLGGSIGWLLFVINIFGFTLIFWKFWSLRRFRLVERPLLPKAIEQKLLKCRVAEATLLEAARTEIAIAFTPLSSGLTMIQNIATTAPLLGLLGTVIGIFQAFGVIAEKGLDDPALFAGGIKLALVTTVIGLVVAIPHMVAYNHFASSLDQQQDALENEVLLHLSEERGS